MKRMKRMMMTTINPRTYEAYQLLHSGKLALNRAEIAGMRIDMVYAEKKKMYITRRIERMERMFMITDFYKEWQKSKRNKVNIYSSTQLRDFLYTVKNLKPDHLTESGLGATDEDALTQLDIPELNNIVEIKKLKKVRDTYLDAFMREQVDGYIHADFNLHLVTSYRSCVAKGTLVLAVRDFLKYPKGIPIEEIKVGDYVYCFDNHLNP